MEMKLKNKKPAHNEVAEKVLLRLQVTCKRGIALFSDAGHPHDPHPENPLHSQQGLMAARPAYHAGY